MALFTLPLAHSFILILCLVFTNYALDCPNADFKVIAHYGQRFNLRSYVPFGPSHESSSLFYVAYGYSSHQVGKEKTLMPAEWVITLVDAHHHKAHENDASAASRIKTRAMTARNMFKGKSSVADDDMFQLFKCKESFWDSITQQEKASLPKLRRKGIPKPVCCVASYQIDSPKSPHAFSVLPSAYYKVLNDKFTDFTRGEHKPQTDKQVAFTNANDNNNQFYWAHFSPKDDSATQTLQIIDACPNPPVPGSKLECLGIPFDTPDRDAMPFGSCANLEACDTGFTNHLVVFEGTLDCGGILRLSARKAKRFLKLAFSETGEFDTREMFKLLACRLDQVQYYPITALFEMKKQAYPSYNSIGLSWQLGALCAACPLLRFEISVSEKVAKMNKQRIENSLKTGFGYGDTGLDYTAKYFYEFGETLTSGQTTRIRAHCNAFYLWYWTISVGTWGTGDASIPTQFFYCTDRQTPPICQPRIGQTKQQTLLPGERRWCNGADAPSDFDPNAEYKEWTDNSMPGQWKSFHAGRPQPFRLQGQHRNFNEHQHPFLIRMVSEQDAQKGNAGTGVVDVVNSSDGVYGLLSGVAMMAVCLCCVCSGLCGGVYLGYQYKLKRML